MRSTARGKIRQVIDRRKEATWWQRSAEQARAMSRVIETVEAAEEKLRARRRDGMNRLQAVRQLLEKERKRERVSTAVQVAKQEQLAQEQQAQRSTSAGPKMFRQRYSKSARSRDMPRPSRA